MDKRKGKFIVFDGPDGCGKTTQFRKFGQYLSGKNLVVNSIREPGGTKIGEGIRMILLDVEHKNMSNATELFLFFAARAQLINEVIQPALERGEVVLADRYFTSTLAYQGYAGNIPLKHVESLVDMTCKDCMFDLAFLLDVTPEVAARRLNPLLDRIELKGGEYHRKVREGYLDIAKKYPEQIRVIDSTPEMDAVTGNINKVFEDYAQRTNFYEGLRRTD